MMALLFVLFSQFFPTGFDYDSYRINVRNAWIINSLITRRMPPEIVNAFNYIEFRKELVRRGILPPLPFLDEDLWWFFEDYTDFASTYEADSSTFGPDPYAVPGYGLYDSESDMFKLRLAIESLRENMRRYVNPQNSADFGVNNEYTNNVSWNYLRGFGIDRYADQYDSKDLNLRKFYTPVTY